MWGCFPWCSAQVAQVVATAEVNRLRQDNIPTHDWLKELKRPPYLSPWRRIQDIFLLESVLGRGATAIVLACSHKRTGEQFAVKCINKAKTAAVYACLEGSVSSRLVTEIEISMKIRHRHIIDIMDVFETEHSIWVVMEMMSGGELFHHLIENEFLDESDAMSIIRQLTSALAHIHHHSIIHRDLKPENIMIRRPVAEEADSKVFIKLIDFGMSKELSPNTTRTGSCLGSPGYTAPEIIRQENYTSAVDMYSLGVITYSVLCGYMPVQVLAATLDRRHMQLVVLFPPREWQYVSAEAKDFVKQLLLRKPTSRMSAAEALQHPWLNQHKVFLRRESLLQHHAASKHMKKPPLRATMHALPSKAEMQIKMESKLETKIRRALSAPAKVSGSEERSAHN